MHTLKTLLKKLTQKDPLDITTQKSPPTQSFSQAVHTYQSLSQDQRQQFRQGLSRKFSRNLGINQILNLLILCDFLAGTNPEIFGGVGFPKGLWKYLDGMRNLKIRTGSKEDKVRLAQYNYLYFYLEFLKEKLWRNSVELGNQINFDSLEDGLIYCQSAITALKLTLRHDFIIQYTLTNSTHPQFNLSTENILRHTSQDLPILIRFIDKHIHLIPQQTEHSVRINQIYEQLIYVSKNVHKLEFLAGWGKRLGGGSTGSTGSGDCGAIKFPRYEINKNVNLAVQRSMIGREGERRLLQTGGCKRIKTQGDIGQFDNNQITETEIYMKVNF